MRALDEYIKRYGICPLEPEEKDVYKTGLAYFILGWDCAAAELQAALSSASAIRATSGWISTGKNDDNMPKMNTRRAQELIVPLKKGTANGISDAWTARLIEALEYVIENEAPQQGAQADVCTCVANIGWIQHTDWEECTTCGKHRDAH